MELTLAIQDQESQLIAACVKNERWAQKELYERYYHSLMRVCLRYANNEHEAQDMLHDGFIKVFSNISRYKVGTSLSAWLHRLMVNSCIDQYRKDLRRKTEPLTHAFEYSNQEADALSQCSEQEILRAVQQLTPVYRIVFNLYVMEGYAHREIADLLGISESTSRSNLAKARSNLKEVLLHYTNRFSRDE